MYISQFKPTDFFSGDGADQILGALALWLPLPALYLLSFIVEPCSPGPGGCGRRDSRAVQSPR